MFCLGFKDGTFGRITTIVQRSCGLCQNIFINSNLCLFDTG